MGHIDTRKLYHQVGKKIDGLSMRVPWNETFYQILKNRFSEKEADLFVKMPYGLSDIKRIQKVTRYGLSDLEPLLRSMSSKGLVMDLWVKDSQHYMPSPLIVGLFEFTMMQTGKEADIKVMAGLFNLYLESDNAGFYAANADAGKMVFPLRALPHRETIDPPEYMEVLDYEKAASIIESAEKYAIGICACRHEKFHIGKKTCDVPLEKCSSFDHGAEYLIRNKLAREVSKTQMLENLAQSVEMKLTICADNVKRNVSFICHCCKDCCEAIGAINKYGYPKRVITSSFIAETKPDACSGCGKCSEACPIDAIRMSPVDAPHTKKAREPIIDASICLGCGVCGLNCVRGAVKLVKRGQRVLHPETTFERIILQCLERGTLQNLLFDNPQSISQKFMRALIGGFLILPPVKAALMSDVFRSSFLHALAAGAKRQGKGWIAEL